MLRRYANPPDLRELLDTPDENYELEEVENYQNLPDDDESEWDGFSLSEQARWEADPVLAQIAKPTNNWGFRTPQRWRSQRLVGCNMVYSWWRWDFFGKTQCAHCGELFSETRGLKVDTGFLDGSGLRWFVHLDCWEEYENGTNQFQTEKTNDLD